MKTVVRDFAAAFLTGFLLPAVLLGVGVLWQEQKEPVIQLQPSETVLLPENKRRYPMLFRQKDVTVQRDLDEYLVGVVLAEMPANFEQEALKAQAVAARTYTRKAYETGGKHGDGSVCGNASCCQSYISESDYIVRGGTRENADKVRAAVEATAGEVLTYAGELIEATYFSCSGGSTENAAEVWGTEFPYLTAVDSPGEEEAAHYRDTVIFSSEAFAGALELEYEGDPEDWFGLTSYTSAGTVRSIVIKNREFSGTELRGALGLNSAAFVLEVTEKGIEVTTRGYGHRVGMSQYGAEAMAVSGSSYREILSHYYPGTELTCLQPDETAEYDG